MSEALPKKSCKRKRLVSSLGSFAFVVGLLLAIRWILIEPYVIPSGSMIPSLLIHDHIAVTKWNYGLRWPFTKKWIVQWGKPKRGDVVVFRSLHDDNYFMVKRVVGIEGDQLNFEEDGRLFVNGELIRQDLSGESQFYAVDKDDIGGKVETQSLLTEYLGASPHRILLAKGAGRWKSQVTVPKGHLFLLGDNRDNSRDSRFWGPLPVENLLGKAGFVWLSCDRTLSSYSSLCHPMTIRWDRFFYWVR